MSDKHTVMLLVTLLIWWLAFGQLIVSLIVDMVLWMLGKGKDK